MTRDLIARRVHWSFIIWLAGMVNVTAMLPQLVRIIRTRNTEGLSLAMFVLYFLVQIAFSIEGFFKKNRMLMVCMGLSAIVSGTIILLVTFLRRFGG
jgi:MtN3 and saliva related transmembrane protein